MEKKEEQGENCVSDGYWRDGSYWHILYLSHPWSGVVPNAIICLKEGDMAHTRSSYEKRCFYGLQNKHIPFYLYAANLPITGFIAKCTCV